MSAIVGTGSKPRASALGSGLDLVFDEKPLPGPKAVAFAVERDHRAGHTLQTACESSHVRCELFENSGALASAMSRSIPDLVFLNVTADAADAVEGIHALSQCAYPGMVQFTSENGVLMVEPLRQLARLHSLQALPPMTKPLELSALKSMLRNVTSTVSQAGVPQFGLEEAIRSGWVQFWYQPKISFRTKTLVGIETFVRVFHPHKGLVPPAAVLRNADERAIIALAHHALTETGVASARLSELGLHPAIAINLSLKALRVLPVARIFRDYVAKTSRQPNWIFDVSEEDIAENRPTLKDLDAVFRSIGIRIAVDNFGGGLLPRAVLKELPISEIKIAPGAVSRCDRSSDDARTCKGMIELAHELGATAVAIGVETVAQSLALQRLGCDVGQGFLFGQPLPLEQIMAIIRQRSVSSSAGSAKTS